jgi:PIN domain nuclease of toxin-antitoxin system
VCWHLSQVSLLEIEIKYDLGKLELPETPQNFLPQLIEDSGLNFHSLENKAIFMLGKLPKLHRDPFDRLLIASALVNGWEIATVDPMFDQYPVQIVT